jgi:hypothetical protein
MKNRKHERGAALIATLSLMFTAGMLVGALVIISQISTINISSALSIMRSRYVAEGAANRIRFLIEADRQVFTAVSGEETIYEDYEHDRYLPDGIDHELLYYGTPVKFRILNGNAGVNMGTGSYTSSIGRLASTEEEENNYTIALDVLSSQIADYVDSDDESNGDGLEREQFEDMNIKNLPRNSAIQFREELLWLPGAVNVLPLDRDGRLTFVRLMSVSGGQSNAKPDLYTANYTTLRTIGMLDEEKAAEICRALEIWRRDRTPLADQIDALDLLPLKNLFSWDPSDNYTIVIDHAAPENRPSGKLSVTFTASGIAGPADGIVRYLDWMRY